MPSRPPARSYEPNPLLRTLYDAFFSQIQIDEAWVRQVRSLASTGAVVYILRNLNFVDFLALDYLTKAYDLPRIGYVNELGLWILNPLGGGLRDAFKRRGQDAGVQLQAALDAGASAALFLKRPPNMLDVAALRTKGRGRSEGDAIVYKLIEMQRGQALPIHLVPQVFVWTKRPDTRGTHWLDPLLGPREWPGPLRTVGQFLTNYKFVELKAGEAFDLQRYLRESEQVSEEVHVRRVMYAVLRRLERERRSVTGPASKPPDRARHQILASPYVRSALDTLAKNDVERRALRKRARKLLKQMQAAPDATTIRALEILLDRVFHRIYAGINVDIDGLDRIREAAKQGTLVLLPCHKSHIDYLVLSYVFYEQNLPLPSIAAGDNLSFLPLGPILRRAGAFFIRRSFKGDDLYAIVVEAYIRRLMRDGHAIEVFLEGGRSRTGKLLAPKFGILAMLVRAAASLPGRRVSFVPISIGYERIVETDSYGRELSGGEKSKEDATGLLKTTEVLRHRYGEINLQFGNCLSLDDIANELGVPGKGQLTPEQTRQLCVRLANRVMDEINRVTAVSPGALTALALLSDQRRGVEHEDLIERCRKLLRVPQHIARARVTSSLLAADGSMREQAICDALDMFAEAGAIEALQPVEAGGKSNGPRRQRVGAGVIYRVPERKRIELDNTKNGIVHFYVERALVATALLARPSPAGDARVVRDRVRDLSRLFKYEFRFRADASFDQIFEGTVASMIDAGEVARSEDGALIAGRGVDGLSGQHWLLSYASILQNFLESYRVAARSLSVLVGAGLTQREFIRRALATGTRMYQAAEIDRHEALASPLLQNALRSFVDEGYIVLEGDRYQLASALLASAGAASVETRIAAYLRRSADSVALA